MNTPTKITAVTIATVPHDAQRYDTVGDYVYDGPKGEHLDMTVSDMGDWRFGIACAVHELVEAALLVTKKIDEAQVSEFDEDYERARQFLLSGITVHNESLKRFGFQTAEAHYRSKWACPCEIDNSTEPGEDVHAPYHGEHMVADNIERIVLRELGANWNDYQKTVESMVWRPGYRENGEASEDADG